MWNVEHLGGDPAAIFARAVHGEFSRSVAVIVPDRSCLVLGSSQSIEAVDTAALTASGVSLAKRASGGGAVLVVPRTCLWMDVCLPRNDRLWCDDVVGSFHWLGAVFKSALDEIGVPDTEVHEGRAVASRWSPLVCFAGLGTGEVRSAGKKILGISQRRTRAGALFQCIVEIVGTQSAIAGLVKLDPESRSELEQFLSVSATSIGEMLPDPGFTAELLEKNLLERLAQI